jgi:hypothetical protein
VTATAHGGYACPANDNKYGGMCHACAAGEYQPFEGRTACLKCAAGTVASLTGVRCVRQLTTAAPTKVATKAATKLPKCKTSKWSKWSACSATCGAGSAKRSRKVTPAKKGRRCAEPSHERRACNAKNACPGAPVDCKLGRWSDFKPCSNKCGGGEQTKYHKILHKAIYGGKQCQPTTFTIACNTHECPIDCKVGVLSAWSTCNKECGGGTQTRSRAITQARKNGGARCLPLSCTQPCNTHYCAVDCAMTAWSAWSTCDAKLQRRQTPFAPHHCRSPGVQRQGVPDRHDPHDRLQQRQVR